MYRDPIAEFIVSRTLALALIFPGALKTLNALFEMLERRVIDKTPDLS